MTTDNRNIPRNPQGHQAPDPRQKDSQDSDGCFFHPTLYQLSTKTDDSDDRAGAGKTAPSETPPPAQPNPTPPTTPPDTRIREFENPSVFENSSVRVSEGSLSFRGAAVSRAWDVSPVGEILDHINLTPNPGPSLNEGSPLEAVLQQARLAAHEFSDQILNGTMQGHRVFFTLARHREFRPLSESFKLYELFPAVEVFRDELSSRGVRIAADHFDLSDIESCWLAFESAYGKIHTREGEGLLDVADRMALSDLFEVAWPPTAGPHFRRITRIGFYLSELLSKATGGIFRLNQIAVAKRIDSTQPRVSQVIGSIVRSKLFLVHTPHIPKKRDTRYQLGIVLTNLQKKRYDGKLMRLYDLERRKTKPQDEEN